MKLVEIFDIVKTHGIKGQMVVKSLVNLNHEDLMEKNIVINLGLKKEVLKVKNIKPFKDKYIIKFYDYNNINDVQVFLNKIIEIDSDSIKHHPILLKSFANYTLIIEGNNYSIEKVFNNNAHDIVAFEYQDRNLMIPLVDEFVVVDNKNLTITIKDIAKWL
ncbi:hypothetical protein NPX79_01245 [Spiroplasma endosymbiont of Anurida maritima]|uniref:hypothetical protein n=1 Tax=Spiroplasma endosymbiont of Anurida maritima TaxID=2967972 RepID=UPI0036D41EC7